MGKIFVTIVCFLIILSNTASAFAQQISPSITPIPSPTPVEYQLPYPGILPGHPFYFLKSLRDNIMSLLISSPLKKAEFNLLQSDKNLQAALYLYGQNKDNETVFQTLQASEDYFKKTIDNIEEAKKQGINVLEFERKITIASLKHQELVSNLAESAKDSDKKQFESSLKKMQDLDRQVKAFNSK